MLSCFLGYQNYLFLEKANAKSMGPHQPRMRDSQVTERINPGLSGNLAF